MSYDKGRNNMLEQVVAWLDENRCSYSDDEYRKILDRLQSLSIQ